MTTDNLLAFWGTRDSRLLGWKFLMMAVAGILLGIIGPYDTSEFADIALRFVYWIGLLLLAGAICGPVARHFLPSIQRRAPPVFLALAVYCLVVSVPIFLVVMLADILVISGGAPTLDLSMRFLANVGPLGYLVWFGQVFTITFVIFGGISLVADRLLKRRGETETLPVAGTKNTRFMNRLPPALGKDLLCLSMEDHYLRVHTRLGSTLILMRMADAVAELAHYPGMQVHRSWWVSLAAIDRISRDKRRYTIHLETGLTVPLSQTYVERVREAGYL